MPKANTKPAFEAGTFYQVKLAAAVALMPGVTFRPGAVHRIDGALLNDAAFTGKIMTAVAGTPPASE